MATSEPEEPTGRRRPSRIISILVTLVVAGVFGWFFIRPGVFSIQPGEALPAGVTYVYHSRSPEIPFFASPEGLCLKMQGGVDFFCRTAALEASSELAERMFIRFQYSQWAYERSLGGGEIDQ